MSDCLLHFVVKSVFIHFLHKLANISSLLATMA